MTPIYETLASENFIAIRRRNGFLFVANPLTRFGLIKLGKARSRVQRAHPCLTQRGELYAADAEEAKAVLLTLEGTLETI